jgi:hypothetical protein
MTEPEDLDARLARLSRSTERLRPSPGFEDRAVAAALAGAAPAPTILRFGKGAVALAALAAAAALALAFGVDRSADLALATTYGMEEGAW